VTVQPPYVDRRAPPQQGGREAWIVVCRYGRTGSLIRHERFVGPGAEARARAFYEEQSSVLCGAAQATYRKDVEA
jgi:hypothetical protein